VEILIAIVAGVLLAVVFVVISGPLRDAGRPASESRRPGGEHEQHPSASDERYERAELEAARETKYREIRDAELDLRTGKLSREDYEAIDGSLRGEALEILDRLEALERSTEANNSDEAKPEVEG
jgi:molecular chaperone GrpE (heat shock protein)